METLLSAARPARLGIAGAVLRGERDADVVQHRVLHRDLQVLALAGFLAPIQRAEDGDRQQHAGAGIAERRSRLQRTAVALAGDAHRAAAGLRDHVERQVVLERAAFAEALHLAVDDRRIELADHVGAEAETLDRARGEVLDDHVGLARRGPSPAPGPSGPSD